MSTPRYLKDTSAVMLFYFPYSVNVSLSDRVIQNKRVLIAC